MGKVRREGKTLTITLDLKQILTSPVYERDAFDGKMLFRGPTFADCVLLLAAVMVNAKAPHLIKGKKWAKSMVDITPEKDVQITMIEE